MILIVNQEVLKKKKINKIINNPKKCLQIAFLPSLKKLLMEWGKKIKLNNNNNNKISCINNNFINI